MKLFYNIAALNFYWKFLKNNYQGIHFYKSCRPAVWNFTKIWTPLWVFFKNFEYKCRTLFWRTVICGFFQNLSYWTFLNGCFQKEENDRNIYFVYQINSSIFCKFSVYARSIFSRITTNTIPAKQLSNICFTIIIHYYFCVPEIIFFFRIPRMIFYYIEATSKTVFWPKIVLKSKLKCERIYLKEYKKPLNSFEDVFSRICLAFKAGLTIYQNLTNLNDIHLLDFSQRYYCLCNIVRAFVKSYSKDALFITRSK